MSNTEEKLKNLAANNPTSNWKDKVAYRKENKAWIKKSTRISLRILDALDDKGWNQSDLANALDVSRQQISKLVKGQNDYKLSTITQLEKVLEIQLQAILAEGELVMSEEMIQERVNQGVTDYHKKLSLTQQYFELKNRKPNPHTVMAVESGSEDEYALAG
ncbi:MAG: helix-turn-helix transcriptional regulator [Algoriphagus sp.]|uniref:helix-turn-helix domain-containing protein n=1 Tax=Algoriphagus sp. TaxID=1872435 RepID=UPI002730257F|nr:helix-turn-helix transcriptional regulator [Algoriphagus sp.]MDP2040001.1 helix-turn-helix transcriptional regulator [Algoriphagus sp.]MDP3470924.1 helix-turn-helix transcriptional regulator [Algoriphagus sp.]